MENMKLNNNLECPMLGLGTFMLSPEDAYKYIRGIKNGIFPN